MKHGCIAVSIFATVCALPIAAYSEYRAYELAITDKTSGQSVSIISTLDDIQYFGYYPLRPEETIAIKDTWMCWKRSDNFQPVCPNPRAPAGQPSAEQVPTEPTSKTEGAAPTAP